MRICGWPRTRLTWQEETSRSGRMAMTLERDSRIFVAGHRGMVGSAIVRLLAREGYFNIITRTRDELDLLEQRAVDDFFRRGAIDFVFIAAARVGGILANDTHQADFLYENLMIEANIIHAA